MSLTAGPNKLSHASPILGSKYGAYLSGKLYYGKVSCLSYKHWTSLKKLVRAKQSSFLSGLSVMMEKCFQTVAPGWQVEQGWQS